MEAFVTESQLQSRQSNVIFNNFLFNAMLSYCLQFKQIGTFQTI